jgi:hypothetical protein
LQLKLVPTLIKHILDVRLVHREIGHVELGTILADKDTKADFSIGAAVLLTINSEGVELVFVDKLLKHLCCCV